MADENQTQTSTQTAGETANDIGNIMGGMAGSEKPTTKPGEAGDAGKGVNTPDSGKGGETQHPAWMNQINSELIKDAEKAGKLSKFEKLSDLASAYLDAEGKLGNVLVKPGENSTDEEREAFYKALGKPDAADKYSIKGDEAKMFREMAYKNNLTDEQAKAIYASLQEVGNAAIEQHKAAYAQQAKETQNALLQEYGKDYDPEKACLRLGVESTALNQAILFFLNCPYVQRQMAKEFVLGTPDKQENVEKAFKYVISRLKPIADSGTPKERLEACKQISMLYGLNKPIDIRTNNAMTNVIMSPTPVSDADWEEQAAITMQKNYEGQ